MYQRLINGIEAGKGDFHLHMAAEVEISHGRLSHVMHVHLHLEDGNALPFSAFRSYPQQKIPL